MDNRQNNCKFPVKILSEVAQKPVHYVLRIKLENGVTLLYDEKAGQAIGDDGLTYAPVCRIHEDLDDDAEPVGWYVGEKEVLLQ